MVDGRLNRRRGRRSRVNFGLQWGRGCKALRLGERGARRRRRRDVGVERRDESLVDRLGRGGRGSVERLDDRRGVGLGFVVASAGRGLGGCVGGESRGDSRERTRVVARLLRGRRERRLASAEP